MKTKPRIKADQYETIVLEEGQILQRIKYDFDLTRRGFVQVLGAGLVIASTALGQEVPPRGARGRGGRGGRGGGRGARGPANLAARLHIAPDGTITVMSGKVEGGQGTRALIAMVAAEELRVPVNSLKVILSDTTLCPDDGPSFGSRTTPSTVPSVRSNCAAARELLVDFAAQRWNVARDAVLIRDGAATHGDRRLTYGDLASAQGTAEALRGPIPEGATVTAVSEWKVMGVATPRPNDRDLVTGAHAYPSAVVRPGMLYGKVLRAPAYNASLKSVDVGPAKAMEGVTVVHDGSFVGVTAPTTYLARKAIEAIARTAQWDRQPHIASKDLPKYFRESVNGGMPPSPFTEQLSSAAKVVRASYDVAYVQHCPMEPRSAVAEWENDRLTVWYGGQNPFGVRNELTNALNVPAANVRVIVNDFGGAFGGKHTGETAVEAARLARAAQKPVSVVWTREEEFTWAAFRSAAAMDITASLDANGRITSWHYAVIQQQNAAADTPYDRIPRDFVRIVNPQAQQVLRLGSYRALGSTANMFARECFMDELALAAGKDPLEFRLNHLENPRLRAVLEDAAQKFDWPTKRARTQPNVGVGLACGIEKSSYVAACVEVAVDRPSRTITVRNVTESFECGAIINPTNLRSQVQGAIIQGLGPALSEEMEFEGGIMFNPSFTSYKVPRFKDIPEIQISLLNRPDLPSEGAGETPLIAVAAAIGNAVAHATAERIRRMPMKLRTA